MDSFWQAYNYFSLKTPWVIQPDEPVVSQSKGGATENSVKSQVSIATDKPIVFALGCPPGDGELESMVGKMVTAIGQSLESVHLHWEKGPLKAPRFSKLGPEQKVFVFGKQNIFGQSQTQHGAWFPIGKSGLQAMATFDLQDLKVNSKLKRQTWAHLKAFAGIS